MWKNLPQGEKHKFSVELKTSFKAKIVNFWIMIETCSLYFTEHFMGLAVRMFA